jgi:hypothetical protein
VNHAGEPEPHNKDQREDHAREKGKPPLLLEGCRRFWFGWNSCSPHAPAVRELAIMRWSASEQRDPPTRPCALARCCPLTRCDLDLLSRLFRFCNFSTAPLGSLLR